MTGTDFREAKLDRACFGGANLTDTDLRSAGFAGTDFSDAILQGADLPGVTWDHTICLDGSGSRYNGNTCCDHLKGSVPRAGC